MTSKPGTGASRVWSLNWVIIVRFILYLVIIGFFVQYIYFGEKGQLYHPGQTVLGLVLAFLASLGILALGARGDGGNPYIAATYILDIVVLSHVMLVSGGFNSIFIPFFLPVLIMAPASLPRRYTAVFPSMATLGAVYIGVAHIMVALEEPELLPGVLYPPELLATLSYSYLPHAVVANMLILAVLFFVVAYLSGILSEKLFVEQHLNAEVLSTMQEGVAVVTAKGQFVFVNDEFKHIFPEAANAKTIRDVAGVLFKPEVDGLSLERLFADDMREALIITRDADPNGRPPLEMRISGIRLRQKRGLYGYLFLVLDLTLRKRAEEAEKSLERFSAISTMAAGLAHEIRNPLASLRSAIQEIGDAFPEGSQNQILTDVIISESDRLDGVISRFLDFSRESRLRPVKTRLSGILGELLTMFMHDPKANKVELVLDIHDDPLVYCDPDRIKEVFLNLALNAIQAVPTQGGRLDIVLAASDKGFTKGVEALFIDNGPGIPEQYFSRLFEPFFSGKPNGNGLGLPLSRKQISMHGGDMEAANRPEGGACFRVWLPLEPGDSSKSATRMGIPEWRRYLMGRQP